MWEERERGGEEGQVHGDFTEGIEMGCKRGRLLANRATSTNHPLPSDIRHGGVQGCLLITGKHDPSSPSDAFKPRSRPATRPAMRAIALVHDRKIKIRCTSHHLLIYFLLLSLPLPLSSNPPPPFPPLLTPRSSFMTDRSP